jgi:hypothetical protein
MNQTEPDINAIESEVIRLFKTLSPDRQQQVLSLLTAELDEPHQDA